MCGIVGIASRTPVQDSTWLLAARDAVEHRGPDAASEWWDAERRVGFGHRRLAIIDLSPAGDQPMRDAAGDLCIVFNGEIYNFLDLRDELARIGHAFRSHSDTEVILAAYRHWGTDCLSRLNGMFAFALYDKARQRLFMARDRAGEKPLFYEPGNGTLRFASELKSLFADRRMSHRIDRDALDCYLAMGFVPGERCILEGVKKLPPGHALMFSLSDGIVRSWRYWHLPPAVSRSSGTDSEEQLLDELEVLMQDAVRRQLIADVPVGVLLSGGVDSSLVTAMAVRSKPDIKAFTVRFPGFGSFDETKHARLIADHFGIEHVEIDAADVTVDMLPTLARQFDEPMMDSSMVPTYLVSRLIRRHCKVALGGDGGDELFAGYPHYNRLVWVDQRLGGIPPAMLSPVAQLSETLLPLGVKGRNWLRVLGVDLRSPGNLPLIASQFDRRARRSLLSSHAPWTFSAEAIRQSRVPRVFDLVQRATRMDFENYLVEDILVKVDRASMLNSLEVRAPFLDYRIIEFAFGKVPSHLKATAANRKILLKKLTRRVLPTGFDQDRKQGFSIPLASWLKSGPWQRFFSDVLLSSDATLFSHKTVRKLLRGQYKGRANSERLFGLVMFELWRREYRVSL